MQHQSGEYQSRANGRLVGMRNWFLGAKLARSTSEAVTINVKGERLDDCRENDVFLVSKIPPVHFVPRFVYTKIRPVSNFVDKS
jgi:hypothetical protein